MWVASAWRLVCVLGAGVGVGVGWCLAGWLYLDCGRGGGAGRVPTGGLAGGVVCTDGEREVGRHLHSTASRIGQAQLSMYHAHAHLDG